MVDVKERYQSKTPKERRLFYSANKKEMIADLRVMSNEAFLVKWPVSPQHIGHLKCDPLWTKSPVAVLTPSKPSTNGMPPLPPFSAEWSEAVQLKWLEVWSGRH